MMKVNLKSALIWLCLLGSSPSWGQDRTLNFDGINDYVSWGNTAQGAGPTYTSNPMVMPLVNSDFTIEMWMNSKLTCSPSNNQVLFSFNSWTVGSNRLILGINATGQLYVHDGSGTVGASSLRITGNTNVADGNCHHIAFTYNLATSQITLYVDGVQDVSTNSTFQLAATDIFSLGQEWDNITTTHATEPFQTSQHYYGNMDDVRIWTTTRTAAQVLGNMNTVLTGLEANLYALYTMDQGIASGNNTSITTLTNSSATTSINGAILNFSGVGNTSNFVQKFCSGCMAAMDCSFTTILADVTYTTDVVWSGKYYIANNVIITMDGGAVLDMTNVDAVFGQCAGITVNNNSYVHINNSVLRPCSSSDTWRGILFTAQGESNLNDNIINESTFKNAEVALYFTSEKDGLVSNNLFSNCNYGIRFENNSGVNHSITGNRFVTDGFYPTFNGCYDFVNNTASFGIWSTSTNFTQHVSHNEFVNSNGGLSPMVTGISQSRGAGTFSNNTFTDMLHAFFIGATTGYTNVANNDIEVNFPSSSSITTNNISVLIDGSFGSLIEVNDNRIINNENQSLPHAAIGVMRSSNVSLSGNEIEGFDYGIITQEASNLQISENEISNATSMGISVNLAGEDIPSFITCNTIKMKSFSSSIGLNVENGRRDDEISSNCIFDCATSILLNGPEDLPRVRNNYLYNYMNVGIDVVNHSGNIGVPSSDPGMNTLWSNNNSAVDVQSWPNTITISDNFGMFNISFPTVMISSNNPYHSTASCGHQIYNSPSQGNLNPNYTCDREIALFNGMDKSPQGYVLAANYLTQLDQSSNPFGFISFIVGTYDNLSEAELNTMIDQSTMTEMEISQLKYQFFFSKSDFIQAKDHLELFQPSNQEEADFKQLHLLTLSVIENGYSSMSSASVEFLEEVVEKSSIHSNYAIHLLNNAKDYQDYLFVIPSGVISTKAINTKRIEDNESFLMVYPNPTSSLLTIELIKEVYEDEIQLLSLTGQKIAVYSPNFVAGKTQIDLSGIEAGIYFIVLSNEETGMKKKVKITKVG